MTPPKIAATIRPTGVNFVRVTTVGVIEVEEGESVMVVVVTTELGALGTTPISSRMNKSVSLAVVTNISSV